MRFTVSAALVGLVGCSHAPAVTAPSSPSTPPAAAAPASEALIIERSHAVLDAYDRDDLAALRELFAPDFVRFDSQRISPLAKILEVLAKKPPHPPSMTRTWTEDHAYVRDHDAVFIGLAAEHETGNDSHGNRAFNGWYTMSWTRDGDRWRVAHWTWQQQRSDSERESDEWNDTYVQGIGFNRAPNRLLVDTVKGVKPGRALDVMMGQGRNAVYLATQGWKVTGIDLAIEGLKRAREAATAQHVPLDAIQADAQKYDYGTAAWDLVTMIYAGDSVEIVRKIQPSIARGGLFVVEFFAEQTPGHGGFVPGQLAKLFSGAEWEIQRDDVVDDVPDWATDHAKLVRFVARKK